MSKNELEHAKLWISRANEETGIRMRYARYRMSFWECASILTCSFSLASLGPVIGLSIHPGAHSLAVACWVAGTLFALLLWIESASHYRFWIKQCNQYADTLRVIPLEPDFKRRVWVKGHLVTAFEYHKYLYRFRTTDAKSLENVILPCLLKICANEYRLSLGIARCYRLSWVQEHVGAYLPIPCHVQLARKSRARNSRD